MLTRSSLSLADTLTALAVLFGLEDTLRCTGLDC